MADMENSRLEKALKVIYYILAAVSIILWFVIMFSSSHVISLAWFKIVFGIYFFSSMVYSVVRKKYASARSVSKNRKAIIVIMITLLVIKLIFFY